MIKLPRVGDAELIFVLFSLLKRNFPRSQLHAVVNNYVVEMLPLVNEIAQIIPLAVTLKDQLVDLRKIINNSEYELIIDLHFEYHLFPAMFAALSGRFSLGYDCAERDLSANKNLPFIDSSERAFVIFLQLVFEGDASRGGKCSDWISLVYSTQRLKEP